MDYIDQKQTSSAMADELSKDEFSPGASRPDSPATSESVVSILGCARRSSKTRNTTHKPKSIIKQSRRDDARPGSAGVTGLSGMAESPLLPPVVVDKAAVHAVEVTFSRDTFDSDVIDMDIAKRNSLAMAEQDGGAGHEDGEGEEDAEAAYLRRRVLSPSFRGKTCTPASFVETEYSELRSDDGRPLHSKEAMYHRAVTLMSERCTTSQGLQLLGKEEMRALRRTPLASFKHPPFGPVTPQYFYINQRKPHSNVEPVKAWKGYHGNIYFEPIAIQPARPQASPVPGGARGTNSPVSEPLRQILARTSHNSAVDGGAARKTVDERVAAVRARQATTTSRGRRGSALSSRPARREMHMVILDKKAVFENPDNATLKQDLMWVAGQESTGSLRVDLPAEAKTALAGARETRSAGTTGSNSSSKEKICRGSVAHKIYAMRHGFPNGGGGGGKSLPFLAVTGDKFAPPQRPSPLLQAQTTYSLSSQRGVNSPDLTHLAHTAPHAYDKLPPLEQLRASLKHMGEHGRATGTSPHDLIHMIPPGSTAADRIREQNVRTPDLNPKPFVKYTPEIQYASRQLQEQQRRHQQQHRVK